MFQESNKLTFPTEIAPLQNFGVPMSDLMSRILFAFLSISLLLTVSIHILSLRTSPILRFLCITASRKCIINTGLSTSLKLRHFSFVLFHLIYATMPLLPRLGRPTHDGSNYINDWGGIVDIRINGGEPGMETVI